MAGTYSIMPEVGRNSRRNRYPAHTFHVRHQPYQIQPFMIAPVLPGETMKNLLMQARAVTQPVKNPIIGWWLEHYFFYVKHRDLENPEFEEMVLNPAWDRSAVETAGGANASMYFAGDGIYWQKLCLDKVVEHFFRNEGELVYDHAIDGIPIASIKGNSWLDSVIYESDFQTNDVNVDLNADSDIMASEVDEAMRQWQIARMHNLTELDYDDWLRAFGIRRAVAEKHVPELLRQTSSWQYPSNTINPTNGTPTSAVSWSIAERADKARFFPEPGFILGVSVLRPKVYLKNQTGAAAWYFRDIFTWLPKVIGGDIGASMRHIQDAFTAGTPDVIKGPLAGVTEDYWVDVRDLLIYGDQFFNFELSSTSNGLVALPTANMEKRYVTEADVDALFVGGDGQDFVHQDGVVNLAIAGSQIDHTPGVNARA